MGSLLPDSNSKSERRLSLKLTLRERSTAKTAAASVEDTIEPNSKPSCHEKPSMQQTKSPITIADKATPIVAMTTPLTNTGLMLYQ